MEYQHSPRIDFAHNEYLTTTAGPLGYLTYEYNHGTDVLFADGHVEWIKYPDVQNWGNAIGASSPHAASRSNGWHWWAN
jgi:prepilin-type processing-associated H-X9-DG protein